MNEYLPYIIVSIVVFVLFPVFIRVNIYIDILEKKVYYAFYMFRFFKIYGGYMTIYQEGVAFHLSDTKAVLLPYSEMVDTRKKFEIAKGFLLLHYSQVSEIGLKENLAYASMISIFLQIVSGIFAGYVMNKKIAMSLQVMLCCVKIKIVLKFP